MPPVKKTKTKRTKSKIKKRPPRIFVKKGKLYIRINGKKYLIKDQSDYTKRELMDIILKELLVRKKRAKGKKSLTSKEKLSNEDKELFKEFERLNKGQSKKGLELPARKKQGDDLVATPYNAMVRSFSNLPGDVNIDNRNFIDAERRRLEDERKRLEADINAAAVVPYSRSSAPASYNPRSAPSTVSQAPSLFQGQPTLKAPVATGKLPAVNKSQPAPITGADNKSQAPPATGKKPGKLNLNITPVEEKPPESPPQFLTADVPLLLLKSTDSDFMDRYNDQKNMVLTEFSKQDGKKRAKTLLLGKLIAREKLPIETKRPDGSGGVRSSEDVASDICKYYEDRGEYGKVAAVFNKFFPNGIKNAVAEVINADKPTERRRGDPPPPLHPIEQEEKEIEEEEIKEGIPEEERARRKAEREQQRREERKAQIELEKKIQLEQKSKLGKMAGNLMAAVLARKKALEEEQPPVLEANEPEAQADEKAVGAVVEQVANGVNRLYKGKGLKTEEIDKMMSPLSAYMGTYPADFLTFLLEQHPIGTADSITEKKRFGFIMNLDKSNKNGSHWVAVWIDTINDMSIDYYDSFGMEPTRDFMKQMKKLVEKLDVSVYLKFKVNKVKNQSTSSQNCGWFAMKFIIDRNNGIPFKECSGYRETIRGRGRQDNSKKKEENIEKFKNKFGYI